MADEEREVARLRGPLPARNMNKLVDYLETAYGKGLVMQQDGEWFVFLKPAVEHG